MAVQSAIYFGEENDAMSDSSQHKIKQRRSEYEWKVLKALSSFIPRKYPHQEVFEF